MRKNTFFTTMAGACVKLSVDTMVVYVIKLNKKEWQTMKRTIYLNEHLEEQIGKIANYLHMPVSTFIRLVLEQTDFEAMARMLDMPTTDLVNMLLALQIEMEKGGNTNGKRKKS